MFQFQNIWFPDGEKHFPDWMKQNGEIVDGRGTYQIKKLRAAIEHCKQFRHAVDIGAHVGLWSIHLAKRFQMLTAFEPVPEFAECWLKNMANVSPNTSCVGVALGASRGRVAMKIPSLDSGIDSGGTHVSGPGDIELHTLDSFELKDVDFIKIDCEGYELEVLKGARDTLERCKPCVIVEQKPHKMGPNFGIKGTPAVDYLREMGAELKREISGDFILAW